MKVKDVKTDGQEDNDQPLIDPIVMDGQSGACLEIRKDLLQDSQCIKSRKDTYNPEREYILVQDGLYLLQEWHQPEGQQGRVVCKDQQSQVEINKIGQHNENGYLPIEVSAAVFVLLP